MDIFDIAIIGAGPAGATLARLLAGKMSAAVIDKKRAVPGGFRKPCGGLLAPDAQKILSRFNLTLPKDILVDPQIFAVKTLDMQSGRFRYYQRFYMNLDRNRFDQWLISLIPDSISFFDGIVTAISRRDGIFYIDYKAGEKTHTIAAKRLAGADGAASAVRSRFFPDHQIRRYISIQQWFADDHAQPLYSCIFDASVSDCCSWLISKDGYTIFGGAFPVHGGRAGFEKQKKDLANFGFFLDKAQRTEACLVLRPASVGEICCGSKDIFLLGEAAGLISPSSLEGISWAIESACCLADALLKAEGGAERELALYKKDLRHLRRKMWFKLAKCPFIYNPNLRDLILRSGIKSIKMAD